MLGRLWTLSAAACGLFCANVGILLIVGSYDIRLGPLHLAAHSLFKPFLLTGAGFWIAVFLRGLISQSSSPILWPSRIPPSVPLAIVLALCAAVYIPSVGINVSNPGWILSDVTARLRSFPDAIRLFTSPQGDGFYRPLTFLSLWVDYRLFGSALWGFHLQNILLHALNSTLVYHLARGFKLGTGASVWSAAWFSLAAINFEPVLWPAARFDLLATCFVLVSMIYFLRYLRDPAPAGAMLLASAAAYGLALMNKETAYGLPLLLIVIVLTRRVWLLGLLDRLKLLRSALAFAIVTSLMLGVRLAIYHGLGGYPAATHAGVSPHFSFTIKSLTGILTRVIPLPLMGLNTSAPLPAAMACFVVLYVAVVAWVVWQGASLGKPEGVFLGLALLSAVPVLNLAGWVGGSMQHSRYLYLPGLWIVMAVSSLIARRPHGNLILALLVAANLAGLAYNLDVYRSMLERARGISQQISDECGQYRARVVDLGDIDDGPSGVLFFRSEIIAPLRIAQPRVCISEIAGSCDPTQPALHYEWLPASGAARAHYLPQGLESR